MKTYDDKKRIIAKIGVFITISSVLAPLAFSQEFQQESNPEDMIAVVKILLSILAIYTFYFLMKVFIRRAMFALRIIEPDGRKKSGYKYTAFGIYVKRVFWILILILLFASAYISSQKPGL